MPLSEQAVATGTAAEIEAKAAAEVAAASVHSAAYAFVRQLAAELSVSPLELPSYPQIALRVQQLLTDDNVSSDRLVRVMGAEPMLAARILAMANSAALNTSGQVVDDLRTAVMRLGFDSLRTAVIGYAMAQQRQAQDFKNIQRPMNALWHHSMQVSAMCFVVARKTGRFKPDTALLVGVLSGVGKLYILTRACRHPDLFANPAAYADIVRDWHANIAQALLDSWQMSEEIVNAVHDFEAAGEDKRRTANLADVLAAAQLLVSFREAPDVLQIKVPESIFMSRLGLDAVACSSLISESAEEVSSLMAALG